MKKLFATILAVPMFLAFAGAATAADMNCTTADGDLFLSKQTMTDDAFVEDGLVAIDTKTGNATWCPTRETWAANYEAGADDSYQVTLVLTDGETPIVMKRGHGIFGADWTDVDGTRHRLLDQRKMRSIDAKTPAQLADLTPLK